MKLLKGITHSIVRVRSQSDSNDGTLAEVELYFDQTTAIKGIRYMRSSSGATSWFGPVINVYKNGQVELIPVFTGDLLIEICKLASRSIERIKQQFGHPDWNKNYMILKDRIEVI